MTLKQLQKAEKISLEIKQLDSAIIELEKHAMEIANDETEVLMTMKVENKRKEQEEKEKVGFDEEGSLTIGSLENMYRRMNPFYMGMVELGVRKRPESVTELNISISTNASLQILGVLLCEKQTRRETLLRQLENLGVSIN